MNRFDKAIAWASPERALRRVEARNRLAQYEQAKPSRTRRTQRSTGSGDSLLDLSGKSLREQARYLDENHDVAVGILDVLVDRIVGKGIQVQPQVRTPDGDLNDYANERLEELWADWIIRPEVTWQYDWGSAELELARSWLRDGDVFGQMLSGSIPTLQHGTQVPFSVEMIESDFCPLDFNDEASVTRQGIERNAWGRPRAYYFHKQHPQDTYRFTTLKTDLKRVPAENVFMLKYARRLSQLRGVSVFHAVIGRLSDVKSYEEYERVAAQVAAALTVFVTRDGTVECDVPTDAATGLPTRSIGPGMILEGQQGESVQVIQSNRPNNQIEAYREGQLRATAAGVGSGYSQISKDYSGTFSSQRQELVESNEHFKSVRGYFVNQCSRPVYSRFASMAQAAGLMRDVKDWDAASLSDALFIGPAMPWIDPVKESNARKTEWEMGTRSITEMIRERGGNPRRTIEQVNKDRAVLGMPEGAEEGADDGEEDE